MNDNTKELHGSAENSHIEDKVDKELKTQQIAENLGIGESTVRKYAQALEKSNYVFKKDPVLGRIYTENDQLAIFELTKLRKEKKIPVDVAANMVALQKDSGKSNVSPTQDVQPLSRQDLKNELLREILEETRYVRELQKEYAEQMSEDLESARGELRTVKEENKEIKEELAKMTKLLERVEEKQNQGFFQRLFNKK